MTLILLLAACGAANSDETSEIAALEQRITELEQQLAQATATTVSTAAASTTTIPATTTTTEEMSPLAAHPHEWGTTDGYFTVVQEQEYCDWLHIEAEEAYRAYIVNAAADLQARANEFWDRHNELTEQLADHASVCA